MPLIRSLEIDITRPVTAGDIRELAEALDAGGVIDDIQAEQVFAGFNEDVIGFKFNY